MSADEFDPMIERLFAQAPSLPDEALFLATVKARMETRSRWRAVTLTAAGLIGGVLVCLLVTLVIAAVIAHRRNLTPNYLARRAGKLAHAA